MLNNKQQPQVIVQEENIKNSQKLINDFITSKDNPIVSFNVFDKVNFNTICLISQIISLGFKSSTFSQDLYIITMDKNRYNFISKLNGINIQIKELKNNEFLYDDKGEITKSNDIQNITKSLIIIDDISAIFPQKIKDKKHTIDIAKNKIYDKLIANNMTNDNQFVVIDNISPNITNPKVSKNEIYISKTPNPTKISIKVNTNKQTDTFDILTKNSINNELDEWDIDNDYELEELELPRPKINIKLLDEIISSANLTFGNISPITIKKQTVVDRNLTKTTLKLAVSKANFNIPILYIAPFDKMSEIKKNLLDLSVISVDKKAIKRTHFCTIENVAKSLDNVKTEQLIDEIFKMKIEEFSTKYNYFITILDIFDAKQYNATFDYNSMKILSKAYNSLTFVGLSDINSRYSQPRDYEVIKYKESKIKRLENK